MKNLILVAALFFVGGMVEMNAQCSHAKAASTSCSSKSASVSEAALKAADADPTIEKKVCEKSGKVSFYRTTKDESGASVSTQVTYDEGKAMFVNYSADANAAPAAGTSKACCSGKAAKACCSSKKGAKSCSGNKAENTAPVN